MRYFSFVSCLFLLICSNSVFGQTQSTPIKMKTEKDWKEKLSPEAYHILGKKNRKSIY